MDLPHQRARRRRRGGAVDRLAAGGDRTRIPAGSTSPGSCCRHPVSRSCSTRCRSGREQGWVSAKTLGVRVRRRGLHRRPDRRRAAGQPSDPHVPPAPRPAASARSTSPSSMTYAGFFGLIFVLPLYLQSLRGYSAFQSGLAQSPQALGVFLVSNLLGRRLYRAIGPAPADGRRDRAHGDRHVLLLPRRARHAVVDDRPAVVAVAACRPAWCSCRSRPRSTAPPRMSTPGGRRRCSTRNARSPTPAASPWRRR